MSKIHDALRRAERLGQPDEVPSMDILADFDGTSPMPDVQFPTNGRGLASATDTEQVLQSVMPAEGTSLPPVVVQPDFTEMNGASDSSQLMDDEFKQLAWSAPNSETLFFLQPEENHQIEREQFRTLRSRLYQIRANQPIRTILVSSALPAEGKTFVSANLALAISRQHGSRVLLIDADLRKSGLCQLLGAPSSPGLAEYLAGKCDIPSIIQKAPITNLCFVPAGAEASNPGELIGNGRLARLIEGVSTIFDWIILDSPPAVPIADASLIAEACDGVLLVVKGSSTGFDVAKKACGEFRRKPVLGVVLNRAEVVSGYQAYYHSQYSKAAPQKEKKG